MADDKAVGFIREHTNYMKVLVTGNEGYIGSVLAPKLAEQGHKVTGLDLGIFKDVAFVPRPPAPLTQIYKDIRDITHADLSGFDAIIHLAGLSNDPLGALNPEVTFDINHRATVELAKNAKKAGVPRFLFSSSCSMYGVANKDLVDEAASFDPQSAYAKAKVLAERDLLLLADDSFCPVFLRNSTVFGISPRTRLDLIVQNLAAYGYLNKVITILSDGTPWRPQVHVQDVAEAFAFFLTLPPEAVSGQAYNIGRNENNLQIKDIAGMVQAALPGTSIEIKNQNPADNRSYKVDFSKLASIGCAPRWSVSDGIAEVLAVFKKNGFSNDDFISDRYITIKRYQNLMASGTLDSDLRIVA